MLESVAADDRPFRADGEPDSNEYSSKLAKSPAFAPEPAAEDTPDEVPETDGNESSPDKTFELSVPEAVLFNCDDDEPDNNSEASKSAKFAVLFVDLFVPALDEDDTDGA